MPLKLSLIHISDIEDSIEFESKETKSEDHIPDETANLSNLRSVLEATELSLIHILLG